MSIGKEMMQYDFCSSIKNDNDKKKKDNDKSSTLTSIYLIIMYTLAIFKFDSRFICNETDVVHLTEPQKQFTWIGQNLKQFNTFSRLEHQHI
jgi:hypothetical protein